MDSLGVSDVELASGKWGREPSAAGDRLLAGSAWLSPPQLGEDPG